MSDEGGCTLCDLPLGGTAVTNDAGERFCCPGCRGVYATLEEREGTDGPVGIDECDAPGGDDGSVGREDEPPEGYQTTHFRVDGMHCATCERFLESRASGEGVGGVDASYITDTVRVEHDPAVGPDDLKERLTGLGYRAYDRDDPRGERGAEDNVLLRLVVGSLFGMMVMLNYVALIYPTYFENGLYYPAETAAFLAAMLASPSATHFFLVVGLLSGVVLFYTGGPILKGAYVSLRTRQPNMDLLVALAASSAWVYSTLAIFLGGEHVYYDVTVAVVLVVTAGGYYENRIKGEATGRLADLTAAGVREARRYEPDGSTTTVDVGDLLAGESILVRAGERVPLDGTVREGEGAVDEAVVTGESLPVPKEPGSTVVGGSLLQDGSLVVEVGDPPENSVERITDVVWNLQSADSGVQQLADRLATVFVPLVLALAVVVGVVNLALGTGVGAALLVALTVLIVSCPCALGLATPLAIASSVREALERGIVVFDETIFERLRGIDVVVFDKTGTLTTGEMRVRDSEGPRALFERAALLETRSSHPIAAAIAAEFTPGEARTATDGGVADRAADDRQTTGGEGQTDTLETRVREFESYARGVGGTVDGVSVLVGHPDLFGERGWTLPEDVDSTVERARDAGAVPVVVGEDGVAEGVVIVGDDPREGWSEALSCLDERGLDVAILTGDDEQAAAAFGEHPAVDHVFAGVPPEGKAEAVARFGRDRQVAMVGDGTNDAPALAAADLGIALGDATALAADAADAAVVTGDLVSLETVFDLSVAANGRVKQNIGWAFLYNAVAIPLAVVGLINPLFAAVAMAGSSLLVVTNSSRSLL